MRLFARFCAAVPLIALSACAPPHAGHDHEPDGPEPVGEAAFALTVGEAVSAGCATSSVKGLSLQIIAQAACITPGSFVEVPQTPNLTFTDPVLPYLEEPAKNALLAALADKPQTPMQINSMLRTVAQQYLLYEWYQQGLCGIALAATPGNSNHETGLALDVDQPDTWKPTLANKGFVWYGPDDPVHFDYEGPGAINYKGTDVLAFQVLWNKNHPEDTIAEDGDYGPQTESRLKQSPSEGFPLGADCALTGPTPDVHLKMGVVDAADTLVDGASQGRVDIHVGDVRAVELLLTNKGNSPAEKVEIGIEATSPYVTVLDYIIESDFGHQGTFELNDANNSPENPAHGSALGPSFGLVLNAFSKGETKRATLTLRADAYSITKDVAPEVRFFVKNVESFYSQADYDAAPTNKNSSQTFGGGVLKVATPLDVYSRSQWLWDTDRREGWTPESQLSPDVSTGNLVIAPGRGGLVWSESPALSLSAESLTFIEVRGAAASGESYLYFATDTSPDFNETARISLNLPSDSIGEVMVIDVADEALWTGTLTKVGLGFTGAAPAQLDLLRLVGEPTPEGGTGGSGGAGQGGGGGDSPETVACACQLPGGPLGGERWSGGFWVMVVIGFLGARYRPASSKVRRGPDKARPTFR